MKVQQELGETKVVLHKTIESVLQRGEKLDQLVERSDALSMQSRMFYKTAKKQVSTPSPSFDECADLIRIRVVWLCRVGNGALDSFCIWSTSTLIWIFYSL
jgi:hypothetical protein